MIKVVLLSHTEFPERLVAAAAKNCYSASGVDTLYEDLTDEAASGFVDMLSQLGHESPIEHAVFTFGIEGVSRSLLAQLTRHRIASFSVKSQRYVGEKDFAYVIPPEIECIPEAKAIFIEEMRRDARAYETLREILTKSHAKTLVEGGMEESAAVKSAARQANEDARYVLPNACETKIVMTMNARSLKNFFRQRCCNRAQWEIRELAEMMFALAAQQAPALFRDAGPACVAGACPEGKMSCGKARQMRAKYTDRR